MNVKVYWIEKHALIEAVARAADLPGVSDLYLDGFTGVNQTARFRGEYMANGVAFLVGKIAALVPTKGAGIARIELSAGDDFYQRLATELGIPGLSSIHALGIETDAVEESRNTLVEGQRFALVSV